MSQVLVDSGTPVRPFWVNDHGRDNRESISIISGSSVLVGGTVLALSGTTGKYTAYDSGTHEPAAGLLVHRVDPRNGDEIGALMTHGTVLSGLLTGLDQAAVNALSHDITFR